MHISYVRIQGFRNFYDAEINLGESTLLIGANDVGKTNFLYALRLLLDRSLPDASLDPCETDFHVLSDGTQVDGCDICIRFNNVDKDAVISNLRGSISDEGVTFLRYSAEKSTLKRFLHIGASQDLMEEIPSRHYLRFINLRYVQSQRDLSSFIQYEKRHLLRLSKAARTDTEIGQDEILSATVATSLDGINDNVGKLNYVLNATQAVNEELQKLSHHNGRYEVRLETGAIEASQFIDKLELAGASGGSRIGLGGDGRNNQILMALWKVKSEREQDLENECVIYCIEEPEAHLHPHQQRKLAEYLSLSLSGQLLVTTHSPQIAARFNPASLVRFVSNGVATRAANDGCSANVEEAWLKMSFRMSVLPAEAFFADMVFLVEGPSEVLLYNELARQIGIDLDRLNLSIVSVDGMDFSPYIDILDALEIPFALRTDNDINKVQYSHPPKMRFAGLNRVRSMIDEDAYEDVGASCSPEDVQRKWQETSIISNPRGLFLSKRGLEEDLVALLPNECMAFTGADNEPDAVAELQKRKATTMSLFLRAHRASLGLLKNSDLSAPLEYCIEAITGQ